MTDPDCKPAVKRPRAGRNPTHAATIAAMAGVSERTIYSMADVARYAPDLEPLVMAGTMSGGDACRELKRRRRVVTAEILNCDPRRIEAGELRLRAASLRRQADKLDRRAAELLAEALEAASGGAS